MKSAKLIAIAIIAVLSISAFSGCTARNRDNVGIASSLPPVIGSEPYVENPAVDDDVLDRTAPPADGVESRIDNDLENRTSHPEISGIEPHSEVIREESVASAMSADFSEIGALSGEKDTGFPGGPVDEMNRPSGPLGYQTRYEKYGAYFIVPDSKKIYLTFDEGYENGYTSRILDTLKEKNVKAVFFITYPYAKSEPALVKRMVDEGHTLGNHSTKHQIYPDLPLAEAAEDLMTLHEYVCANYGYTMSLFRPPEGAFSEQTLALAQSLGYNTMLWSFAYKDYDVQNQPIAIEAMDTIIKKAHPGEICLLHAVSRTNAEILGDVIDNLREKGFVFADYFYFQ